MLLKPQLLTKLRSQELTLAVAGAVCRLSLQATMGDILEHLTDLFDEGIAALWSTARRARISMCTFGAHAWDTCGVGPSPLFFFIGLEVGRFRAISGVGVLSIPSLPVLWEGV